MKLHRLAAPQKRGKSDESAEMREPEGIEIHVSHDHMGQMGMDEPPRAGTEIEMHGRGHVVASHTEEVDGKPRHHIRVRLTHAGMEHEPGADDRKMQLRGDIEKAAEKKAS